MHLWQGKEKSGNDDRSHSRGRSPKGKGKGRGRSPSKGRGKGDGVCYFFLKGTRNKGDEYTYKHEMNSSFAAPAQPSSIAKADANSNSDDEQSEKSKKNKNRNKKKRVAAPAILIPALTALVATALPVVNASVVVPEPVVNFSQAYADFIPKAMPAYSCSSVNKKKECRVSFADIAEVSTFPVDHDMEKTPTWHYKPSYQHDVRVHTLDPKKEENKAVQRAKTLGSLRV